MRDVSLTSESTARPSYADRSTQFSLEPGRLNVNGSIQLAEIFARGAQQLALSRILAALLGLVPGS
jgi:hypothetical protein